MTHELPSLEYEYNSLEPFIDEETMRIHHTKHHQAYVDKLNEAISKYPELENKKVEKLLNNNLEIVPEEIKSAVKNHGGGHINHSLFWKILSKNKPMSDNFKQIIEKEFDSIDNFKKEFTSAAMARFGSGWAWLVIASDNKLKIYNSPNQDSPLMQGDKPILGLDVWEHAYYLKYQNKRIDYINAFFEIINWEEVEKIYNSYL